MTADAPGPGAPVPQQQPRNPLHGLTLEAILTALVDHYGWDGLGERIPVLTIRIDEVRAVQRHLL